MSQIPNDAQLGYIDGLDPMSTTIDGYYMDEDDFLLYALLNDTVYCSELLVHDPSNTDYGECYRVRDYQYPLWRTPEFGKTSKNFAAHASARYTGKALADDAPVLTPRGYRPISELQVGDLVIGSEGMPTPVIGVYPQGERDLYRVTFRDGATVDCDDEHLWTVTCDYRQTRKQGTYTMKLSEIRSRKTNFKVQSPSGPVQFAPLPEPEMDPWLVGALIGDGNLTRPTMIRFSSADEENIERVAAALPADAELVYDGKFGYRVKSREYVLARPGTRSPGRAACALLQWSRAQGLQGKAAHEKTIPQEYLWGSPETRLAVLQGLADTDGYQDRGGSTEISTASPQLAEQIRHLVLSLGGVVSVKQGPTPCRDRYRVLFTIPGTCPFRLSRKRRLWEKASAAHVRDYGWRGIIAIEPIGRGNATCIEVAAEDGLFMANDMVLTHNSESIKGKALRHPFARHGEDLILTAPELIHLQPLTDQIEERIQSVRLTREFLDTRFGRTGFTHRPFGVNFLDGTRIDGRIPRLKGTGVKGAHAPDLIIDEAQDYPPDGWVEVHSTVMMDHTDRDGNPDFTYEFYGVHTGDRSGGFHSRLTEGGFRIVEITAIQRIGWGPEEKAAAKAAFGGTNSPDYRRNVLGEAGEAASALFASSRLMQCVDQDRESEYNEDGYKFQLLRAEDVDDDGLPLVDALDLPHQFENIFIGIDVGLTTSPTVITVFSHEMVDERERLKLIRRYHLERFRSTQIREAIYALHQQFGGKLQGLGMDVTGLGYPIFQDMEDSEFAPKHLLDVSRGYFFNAKVPVGVAPEHVVESDTGQLRDRYGAAVKKEYDEMTGEDRYIVMMAMIEASSRYLREFVDKGFLMLPFDTDVTKDMQLETTQRVRHTGVKERKPNAFHILDSMRAMAMVLKAEEVEREVAPTAQDDVPDFAYDHLLGPSTGGQEQMLEVDMGVHEIF